VCRGTKTTTKTATVTSFNDYLHGTSAINNKYESEERRAEECS